MKNQIRLILCLAFTGVLLATQCTVVKRRYTKGFYVSAAKKVRPANKSDGQRLGAKSKKLSPVATGVALQICNSPVQAPLYASATKKSKRGFVTRPVFTSDSCGDLITFIDGDELKAKIELVTPDYITYRPCDNLTGPLRKSVPSNVFSIKYTNGMVRVIRNETRVPVGAIPESSPKYVAPVRKTNGFARASFISSFFSWLIIPAFLAVAFGAIGLTQFQNHPEKYEGKWMAVAGLIVGVIFVTIILVGITI